MSTPNPLRTFAAGAVVLTLLAVGAFFALRSPSEPQEPQAPQAPQLPSSRTPQASLKPKAKPPAAPDKPQGLLNRSKPSEATDPAPAPSGSPKAPSSASKTDPSAVSSPNRQPNPTAPSNEAQPSAEAAKDEPAKPKKLSMGKEEIREVIQTMKPQVKDCYTKLLKEFPEADGTVLLSFALVSHEGELAVDLEKVGEESSLYDQELNACLLDSLRGVEFPEAEGDGEIRVTYPFVFQANDEPKNGEAP